MRKINLTGQKFGRWGVISEAGRNTCGHVTWLCQCECGTQRVVGGNDLRNGKSESCGCLQKELASKRNLIHGLGENPIYFTWYGMLRRCNNPSDTAYKYYGGRGIAVCERWNKLENFYADMGECPKGLTIERRDNSKGYSPKNCYYATRKEQQRNTRKNIVIKYGGKSQCMAAWAEELGISWNTLRYRLNKYPPQIALNM